MKMRRKGFLAALLGLAAAPVLGKVKTDDSPRWPPLCPKCVWLGQFGPKDLWFCDKPHTLEPKGSGSLGMHWKPDRDCPVAYHWVGADCGIVPGINPPIAEAYRRAVARGLMPKVEPPPKFPRFFIPADVQVDTPFMLAECRGPKEVFNLGHRPPTQMPFGTADCERRVADGRWREITVEQALALLYPTYKRSMRLRIHPDHVGFLNRK